MKFSERLRIAALALLLTAGAFPVSVAAQVRTASDSEACVQALNAPQPASAADLCRAALLDLNRDGSYRIIPASRAAYEALLRDASVLNTYAGWMDRHGDSQQAYNAYQEALRIAYRLVRSPLGARFPSEQAQAQSIVANAAPRYAALSAHVPRARCISQPSPDGFVLPNVDGGRYTGTVEVTVAIDRDGTVTDARFLEASSNAALDKAVMAAARRSTYMPVDECAGTPPSGVYAVRFDPAWPSDVKFADVHPN